MLYLLSDYSEASKILLSSSEKEYTSFLEIVLKNSFCRNIENTSVKFISEATNTKREKATKWIRQIYDDIFLLNEEQPNLFKTEGMKCGLYFSHYDMYCYFYRWLNFTPRLFEHISWNFIRGKMSHGEFWVKRIDYDLNEAEPMAQIYLDGAVLNLYEVLLKDRALFERVIDYTDEIHKGKFEVEKILMDHYKNR